VQDNRNIIGTIPSGYGAQDITDTENRKTSSRHVLKKSALIQWPRHFRYLLNAMNNVEVAMCEYISGQLPATSTAPYKLVDGSLLFDPGFCPHVQRPHRDFVTEKVMEGMGKTLETAHRPMSCIYAVDSFSLILFLRDDGIFGGTVPTRVFVPKGCAIFFDFSLWHSGDRFVIEEDQQKNARMFWYCLPNTLSGHGYIKDGVDREGRKDITGAIVHCVNTIDYLSINEEYAKLVRFNDDHGDKFGLEHRFEKVFSMMIKLYDFVGLTAEGCHKKKSIEERGKITKMCDYARNSYSHYLHEMKGILHSMHNKTAEDDKIIIQIIGEDGSMWRNV
jgi:hypothetical protein